MEEKIESKIKELNLIYDSEDIKSLFLKLCYLKNNNLEKLASRLLEQNKVSKFPETLTEVNFSFQLLNSLRSNKSGFMAYYEPKTGVRPIDLIIEYNNKKYFIQIKYLSSSIRDNKKNKIVKEIERQSKAIKANRGFSLRVSENFTIDQVNELMGFIKINLRKKDNESFKFSGKNGGNAEIELQTPQNNVRQHLVLYSFGDVKAVDVTGEAKEQVKTALLNAAGAFESNSSAENVNLIVSEITNNRRESIDFAEALYGTEFFTFSNGDSHARAHRKNDGVFQQEDFAKKIAAVIVVHRNNSALVSDYEKVICTNPAYDHINSITDLVHDKIIKRYTWIEGGFFK